MPPNFTEKELQALRSEGERILGKQVIIDSLNLPSGNITVSTRGKIALAVSKVHVFSHLVPDTSYKTDFDAVGDRTPGESFAFNPRGYPFVSVVLPDQDNAIAVIKELLSHDGETMTWTHLLEKRLGVKAGDWDAFTEEMDGIDLSRRNATFRLQHVPGATIVPDVTVKPNKKIPNLDSEFRLRSYTRIRLAELLKELLVAERATARA